MARKSFIAFWEKLLTTSQRQALIVHLAGCAACDHSFRIFALSAPLLHGDSIPRDVRRIHGGAEESSVDARRWPRSIGEYRWALVSAALAMSAAAALAFYISRPVSPTLADVILQNADAESDPDVQRATFGFDSAPLFSPQDSNSGFDLPDSASEPDQASQNGIAG